ncbi:MAG: Ig-like domain-containing protein [Bacteroidota bacterium]|nr:Ig-like domain-containing protein [Bacteroidota bacterium]
MSRRPLPALVVLTALLVSCATQRPPSGGPPDTTPPRIVATTPADGTTHYHGDVLVFRFDEYVDRRSFEQAFHITPPLQPPPTFAWSGKKVTVRLHAPLQPNRTYVATVNPTVQDMRAGNRMAETFTLAFSTGSILDHGRLSGRVFDDKPGGVSVFAYALSGKNPDTLDPRYHLPDYVTQTSDDGSFRLTNMADGMYRIIALRDKQGNLRYDQEADAFGVLPSDIAVRQHDTLSPPVAMRLAMEDTTAPYLLSAAAESRYAVIARFSERPIPPPPQTASFLDSTNGTRIGVGDVVETPDTRFGLLYFPTSTLRETTYIFDPGDITDEAGNRIPQTCRSFRIRGSASDSLPVRLVRSNPLIRMTQFPVDSPFTFVFSRLMKTTCAVALLDSSGGTVPVETDWSTPVTLTMRHRPLLPQTSYTLCLDLRKMADSLSGLPAGDTSLCLPFRTGTPSVPGSISGTIENLEGIHAPVRVRARHVEKQHSDRITQAVGTTYTFPEIPEGRYILDAFEDRDGNGVYSPGKPFPFIPSERFGTSADTVRVRAGWETKGPATRIVFH